MLPKKKRVTKEIFQTIMEKGNIIPGSFFVFRYIKQDQPQYAFVAPKKIAKGAVERNSLRRAGYNILRLYNLKTNAGIFFYKKEALSVDNDKIRKDIEFIIKKAGII